MRRPPARASAPPSSPSPPVRRAHEGWRNRLRRLKSLRFRLDKPSRLFLALGLAACIFLGVLGHTLDVGVPRESESGVATLSISRAAGLQQRNTSSPTPTPWAAPSSSPQMDQRQNLSTPEPTASPTPPEPTPSPVYAYVRPICVAPAPELAPLAERPQTFERCADEDFGYGLMRRWRALGTEYCEAGARNRSSSLRGYYMLQARHQGFDVYCELRDGVRFLNGEVYLDDCEAQSTYASSEKRSRYVPRLAPLRTAKWGLRLHYGEPPPPLPNGTHPAAVWNGTTIFVYRDCAPPYNPFHCLNDFIATLLVRDGHNISRDSARVVFLDPFPEGNFIGLWRLLAARVVAKAEWESWGVFPVEHALIAFSSSFIWKDFWIPTPCPHVSPALFDFRALTLETLRRAPVSLMGLNLTSDAGFDPWGEYPLPCDKVGRITVFVRVKAKSGSRYIRNNDAFIRDLIARFPDHDVVAVNPSTATFEQQLQLMHTTDLLIGMHGGAMTNLLYLKPGASVLELHPNTGNPARCYANMAAWAGIPYRLWQERTVMPSPTESIVDLEEVGELARKLVYHETESPSRSPTRAPTTTAPSAAPKTSAPSAPPTTAAPSASPTTSLPSAAPTRARDLAPDLASGAPPASSLPSRGPPRSRPRHETDSHSPSAAPTTSFP